MHTLIASLHALTARQFVVGMMAYGRSESFTAMVVAIGTDLVRQVVEGVA